MQYYRCKCGYTQSWGSKPPRKCQGCPKCNTTLTQSPDTHTEPEPHEWITQYDTNTGEPYEICMICSMGKKQEEERIERAKKELEAP